MGLCYLYRHAHACKNLDNSTENGIMPRSGNARRRFPRRGRLGHAIMAYSTTHYGLFADLSCRKDLCNVSTDSKNLYIIQNGKAWIPAFAGMTESVNRQSINRIGITPLLPLSISLPQINYRVVSHHRCADEYILVNPRCRSVPGPLCREGQSRSCL